MTKKEFWASLAIFALLIPVFLYQDQAISSYFYENGKFVDSSWVRVWYWLGTKMGVCISLFSLFLWGVSFCIRKCKKIRFVAIYLFLVMALGSGGIVNLVFKDHWGRPRPVQIKQFGGNQEFRPFYHPNFSNQRISKSFPCGHVSVGFFFFSIYFLGNKYRKKKLRNLGIILVLIFAGSFGLGRIMQGGHFFSDVISSGLMMWIVAGVLLNVLSRYEKSKWLNSLE